MHRPQTDFSIENLRCRWQEWPARADALAAAGAWLQGLSVGGGVRRDAQGRPRLPDGEGDVGWSHSAGRLLMARAPRGVVGVDVEASGRVVPAMRLARRYFAAEEIEALATLDDARRQHMFLRLWCAKEAVLKATGRGIAFGLHRVAFDVDGANPRMIHCDPALGRVEDWTLHQREPEPGFVAVIATTA